MIDALIHLRVPADTKASWVRESRAAGMRLTDWITSKVEKEMARQTYPGLDGVVIECDLDQAASPVRYSADGRHDADRIAELVDGWLDAEGWQGASMATKAPKDAPAPRKRAPGAGRKPIEGGIVSVNLTLTPAHRDQLKALGGSAWVRKMLDAVRGIENKK